MVLVEPPDISYRKKIIKDQETIDRLLKNVSLHFTEICLRYQCQDLNMECELLDTYYDWALAMDEADKTTDKARCKFFSELWATVSDDYKGVRQEVCKLKHEIHEHNLERRSNRDPSIECRCAGAMHAMGNEKQKRKLKKTPQTHRTHSTTTTIPPATKVTATQQPTKAHLLRTPA